MNIEERNKKLYTEKGLKALKKRLIGWIHLFNEDVFPKEAKVLGFGSFHIKNKEECRSRIQELLELTGEEIKIRTERVKYSEGELIKEIIEYG